jgi:hypothetical protein
VESSLDPHLLAKSFTGARVLITGGLGFIGSSLAVPLAEAGADVTLVDAMIPDYGGNLVNIAPVREQVRVNFCDVRDPNAMNYLVQGRTISSTRLRIHIMSPSDRSRTSTSTSRAPRSCSKPASVTTAVRASSSSARAANTVRRCGCQWPRTRP